MMGFAIHLAISLLQGIRDGADLVRNLVDRRVQGGIREITQICTRLC